MAPINLIPKSFILLLLCISVSYKLMAVEVSINTPFIDTQLCTGTNIFVHYTVSDGSFSPGNMFEVQLSNQYGNFSIPTTIGSLNATSSGTILCSIPVGVTAGSGYRIRISAFNPAYMSNDNDVDIRIFQKPNPPVVSHNSPTCTNDTLKMAVTNVTTGVDYYWAGPSYNGAAQAISFNNAQPADGGNYVVTAVVNGIPGCTASTPVFNMLVKPVPNKPTASSNSPICSGSDLLLKAQSTTPGVSYEWWATGFSSLQQNPVISNITASQGGKYVVAAMMNGCYSKKDTLEVVVKSLPEPSISNNTPVCAGDGIEVKIDNQITAATYSWTGKNGFTSTQPEIFFPKATAIDSGMYILTTIFEGCTRRDTITLKVKPLPVITAQSNSPICELDELKLWSPGESNTSYTWTGPGGFYSNSLNSSIKPALQTHKGDYILKGEREGCTSTDTLSVVVKPLPVTDAASNSPIISGTQLKLKATSAIAGTTYSWAGPGGYTSNEQEPVIQGAMAENSGTYYVTALFDGCSFTDSVNVKVSDTSARNNLSIYPNPSNGEFKIFYSGKKLQQASIFIYSSTGLLVYHEVFDVTTLASVKTIKLDSHLPTGVYIMKVSVDKTQRLFNISVYK